MDLRQMSTFVAVAEELHFGRASIRLNLAQPAVTAQVQAIEKELGLPLLIRSTRRVQLTPAGSVFTSVAFNCFAMSTKAARSHRRSRAKLPARSPSAPSTRQPSVFCPIFLHELADAIQTSAFISATAQPNPSCGTLSADRSISVLSGHWTTTAHCDGRR